MVQATNQAPSVPTRFLYVKDVAELLAVPQMNVIRWIHAGELNASNVAESAKGARNRWRISEQALAEFLEARSSRRAAAAGGSSGAAGEQAKPAKRKRATAKPRKEFF